MLVPVIFGGYINGYGIIRALAEHGIKSVLVDRKGTKPVAAVSKYVYKVCYFHDPESEMEEFLREMIDFGKWLFPEKGILFPTHDEYVITLWKNKKKLSDYFEFPMSDWETVNQMINKKNLYEICGSLGIPYPKTREITMYPEYMEIRGELLFPIIVKPSLWDTELITVLGEKTLIFYDEQHADKFIKKIYRKLRRPAKLVVQEYIQGDIIHMPDITVFCDKQGKIKSWTAAVKLRQFPPQTGTSTMARVLSPDLKMCRITYEMTKKLVETMGFYGVCDAEYMYDVRDGKYKIIEVNTRFHMQNYMLCSAGVDMAYYIYCEHQNIAYQYNEVPKRLVSWCKPVEDRYNAVYYNSKKYKDFGMTRKQWRKSVPKTAIGIIDNDKDIRVFIRYVSGIYRRIISDQIRAVCRIPKRVSVMQFFIKKLRGHKAV